MPNRKMKVPQYIVDGVESAKGGFFGNARVCLNSSDGAILFRNSHCRAFIYLDGEEVYEAIKWLHENGEKLYSIHFGAEEF